MHTAKKKHLRCFFFADLSAQIGLADGVTLQQLRAGALGDNTPRLQHIAPVGHRQRRLRVLLHQQDGGAVGVELADSVGNRLHQQRNDQILPHPEARHIADHQCNGAARGDPPAQGCAVDGRIQGGPQLPAYVGNRLHHIAVQLSDDVLLLQRELHRTAAVCKSIGFHLLHLHIL